MIDDKKLAELEKFNLVIHALLDMVVFLAVLADGMVAYCLV